MEIYTRSAKRAGKGKIGGYNMNVSRFTELTDKWTHFLFKVFEDHKVEATIDPEDFKPRCKNLIYAAIQEAMEDPEEQEGKR